MASAGSPHPDGKRLYILGSSPSVKSGVKRYQIVPAGQPLVRELQRPAGGGSARRLSVTARRERTHLWGPAPRGEERRVNEDERVEVGIEWSRRGFGKAPRAGAGRRIVGRVDDGEHAHPKLRKIDVHVVGAGGVQRGGARSHQRRRALAIGAMASVQASGGGGRGYQGLQRWQKRRQQTTRGGAGNGEYGDRRYGCLDTGICKVRICECRSRSWFRHHSAPGRTWRKRVQ